MTNAGLFIITETNIVAYGFHKTAITELPPSTAESSWLNYMKTKRLAELEVQKSVESGLDAVILNPANIIGPWDYSNWSQAFQLINNNDLPGSPNTKASWCHVDSVAQAHIAAFHKGATGENYLLGGADATTLEAIKIIAKLLDRKSPRVIPKFILQIIARLSVISATFTGKEPDMTPEKVALITNDLVADCSNAIKELEYKPVELQIMLQDCYDWMKSENLIK